MTNNVVYSIQFSLTASDDNILIAPISWPSPNTPTAVYVGTAPTSTPLVLLLPTDGLHRCCVYRKWIIRTQSSLASVFQLPLRSITWRHGLRFSGMEIRAKAWEWLVFGPTHEPSSLYFKKNVRLKVNFLRHYSPPASALWLSRHLKRRLGKAGEFSFSLNPTRSCDADTDSRQWVRAITDLRVPKEKGGSAPAVA